ncbi:NUDIX domain-containing protein, partial [Gallintestinimicrobium sp.]
MLFVKNVVQDLTSAGYGDYKGQWEFPGGKIEPGETPQQAL